MNPLMFWTLFLASFLALLVGLAAALRVLELAFPAFSEWLDRRMPDEPWWDQ